MYHFTQSLLLAGAITVSGAAASAATVTATVTRPTDDKQKLTFAAEKDSLVSREIVAEPHAFDIEIIAQTATEPFMFVMSNFIPKMTFASGLHKEVSRNRGERSSNPNNCSGLSECHRKRNDRPLRRAGHQ